MMGKVIPFKRPTHQCYRKLGVRGWAGGFAPEGGCPLCEKHYTAKREQTKLSAFRGRIRRRGFVK